MHKIIYIAENETDLMGLPINSNNINEVKEGVVGNRANSEASFLVGKLVISFGSLIICIVLFLIFMLIWKKRINDKEESKDYKTEIFENEEETEEKDPINLNTPKNINKCIRTFLENTKNI